MLAVHILYEPLCCPKDSESAFYEALTSRGAAQSRARLRAYGLGYEKFATGGSLSKLTGGVICYGRLIYQLKHAFLNRLITEKQ